jgi:Flp pilus assembly protein TadD
MATVQEALAAALRLQVEGQLGTAAAIYDRILAVCPDQTDALHLSGIVARRRGDRAAAVRRIGRAVALQPDFAEPYNNLGNTLRELGDRAGALHAFHRATRLKPSLAEAYAGHAAVLSELGRPEDGLAVWRAAAAARPDHAETRNGLGNALHMLERGAEAQAAYRAALALDPCFAHAYANLATVLRGGGAADRAALLQRRALRLQPGFAAAFSGLGLALAALDRPAEAADLQARAIALQPDFAGAQSNRGSAVLALNRVEEAVAAYGRAVRLDPALPDPHRNLGIARLLQGRLAEAWPEYEWRLRCTDSPTPVALPRPRWDGGPLDGRVILLYAEQGLGDVLQFVRYVPLVAARGGRVMLCAPRSLERLFAGSGRGLEGVERFVAAGTPLSGFDVHTPLLSLPLAFATTLETIPAAVPYLHADPALVAAWGRRLDAALSMSDGPMSDGPMSDGPMADGAPGTVRRVGVVWAGSPGHGNDRNRSLPLAALAPLARLPGVRLVSLQQGPPLAQLADLPAGMTVLDPAADGGAAVADFADTAAIIANLDLVVTVDTSVAHLAGALGRPVWVLLPFAPDWRWLLGRDDSPWYPTMRLFRQPAPGRWDPVLAQVADRLRLSTL